MTMPASLRQKIATRERREVEAQTLRFEGPLLAAEENFLRDEITSGVPIASAVQALLGDRCASKRDYGRLIRLAVDMRRRARANNQEK